MTRLVKKLTALFLAVVMVMAMGITASAAGTGTITITNAFKGETYKVYKVFDADGNETSISYKLVNGKTTAPTGFTVDGAGNVTYTGTGTDGLTATDIAAIASYVGDSDLVAEATATDSTLKFENLPNGYYYVTTTTGTAVTINSTNPNVSITDKNEKPEVDKKITSTSAGSLDENGKKALAQVGSTVDYESTIQVKNGAKGYVFNDTMTNQKLVADSVVVKVGDDTITAGDTTFILTTTDTTIKIAFADAWIAQQVDKTVTITYSATITSDALTKDPAKNTAYVKYGDASETAKSETEVYNAKVTVTKTDDKNAALAGAGFVLAKTEGEGDSAVTKYYNLTNNVVTWVDSIDNATEYKTTTAEGGNVVTFTGLADGTYTLIEKTVPAGYNKATDTTITVVEGDYTTTNLEQSKTVINNPGSVLPSTGGMGTTLLYVGGIALILGAAVVMIVRKRMA